MGEASKAMQKQGRKKVLIVDDEVAMRQILRLMLERNGYSCIDASDGESGVQTAVVEEPDLIILDFFMPKLTGIGVLNRLKQIDSTKNIPIIIITGYVTRESATQCLRAGAIDFLRKPISSDEISRAVQKTLLNVELGIL